MRLGSWFFGGFLATVVLTTIMAGSQSLGLTRMNIPYLLGTMFTAHRDRAKVVGIGVHLLIGWFFAFLYAAAFEAWGAAGWWRGAIFGLLHSAFLLVVVIPAMPGLHPRMASEQQGPTAKRQLEPPGPLALHYGVRTPLSVVLAHLAYGALIGGFYRLN